MTKISSLFVACQPPTAREARICKWVLRFRKLCSTNHNCLNYGGYFVKLRISEKEGKKKKFEGEKKSDITVRYT